MTVAEVTNVILSYSILEESQDEPAEVLQRVNAFFAPGRGFVVPDDESMGGWKIVERPTFVAAFGGLDVEAFLKHITSLPWREPHSVQVFCCGPEDDGYSAEMAGEAGTIYTVPARRSISRGAMNPRGHRCGGVLAPSEVIVLDTHPPFTFAFRVPGFICEGCHEELIDRDTAVEVWRSQLPASVWNAPSATSKGA